MARNATDMKIWFREDIARVLLGVYAAALHARPIHAETDEFRNGFVAALVSVGLVAGIRPETFLPPEEIDSYRELSQGR